MHTLSPIQVATAGEALIDLIGQDDGRFQPCLGGAVYNLTRALARQGVSTLYLNPLSRDRFGRALADCLRADGVQLAQPTPVAEVTSLAVVAVDGTGQPDYAFYRQGVADRATSADALVQACAPHRQLSMVCTGALALAAEDAAIYLPWLQASQAAGQCVVVDVNLRPSVMPDLDAYRRHILATLQYASLIKASDEDLQHLALPGSTPLAQARQLLLQTPAHCLALTQGAHGASLVTRDGSVYWARELQPVPVVDTVGAGDCFLAGLLAQALHAQIRWDALEAQGARALLEHAVASASLCVQQSGCVPPNRDSVRQRVASVEMAFSCGTAPL